MSIQKIAKNLFYVVIQVRLLYLSGILLTLVIAFIQLHMEKKTSKETKVL